MKHRTKVKILGFILCTLLATPLAVQASIAPDIYTYGTKKSGIYYVYCYAWTGVDNGGWAKTDERCYYLPTNTYDGQLAYKYSATGFAQTPQESYVGLSDYEVTYHYGPNCSAKSE